MDLKFRYKLLEFFQNLSFMRIAYTGPKFEAHHRAPSSLPISNKLGEASFHDGTAVNAQGVYPAGSVH